MPAEDIHIAHLNGIIDHLKTAKAAVIRGYEQAAEELGREGDIQGKDWWEAYQYLQSRLAQIKAEQ